MALEWWQWLLACVAGLIIGLSKTAVAGLGILGVALFATAIPPRESVGIVLLALIAGDLVAVTIYKREASWSHLWRLFPWAAAGVILGALAFGRFDDQGLRKLIGAILAGLAVFTLIRQRTGLGGEGEGLAQRPWLIALTGLTAGFSTMVANASGPIMVLFLLAQRLPKRIFVGTAAWYFLCLNLFKVPFSIGLGLINPATLGITFVFIPFVVLGSLIGRRVLDHINQQHFEQIALLLTLVAGIRLLL